MADSRQIISTGCDGLGKGATPAFDIYTLCRKSVYKRYFMLPYKCESRGEDLFTRLQTNASHIIGEMGGEILATLDFRIRDTVSFVNLLFFSDQGYIQTIPCL